MVSIVTNEDQINKLMISFEPSCTKPVITNTKLNKNLPKKNYYQLEREKMDLTQQIEETLDSAKKAIKDAFIKRGRPDCAFEMELSMDNRITPQLMTRKML